MNPGSGNQYRKFLYENLSLIEFQVMIAMASGKPVNKISQELLIKPEALGTFHESILKKLELKDDSELFHYCTSEGLI
jgi:DNA-binding NarL/FixJ family response regulator